MKKNKKGEKKSGNNDIIRFNPAQFAECVSDGRWRCVPHLECINDLLIGITNRKFYNLIINMPPRHGKSEFISKYFVAWHLIRYPGQRIIFTSYSQQFAELWGRKVREIIDERGKEFGLKIKQRTRSFKSFEIDGFEGGLHCAGAGSSITGRGANLLIIDDPIKNNIEANSSNRREILFDWFQSTAYSRLEPLGITILVMTRWHLSDLTGKIMDNYPVTSYTDFLKPEIALKENGWILLSLPAIAGEGDMLGRNPGDALWPERYSQEKLDEIKTSINPRWFNSLYQQNPLDDESSLFRKSYFKYFYDDENYFYLGSRSEPERIVSKNDCFIRATVDLAITDKKSSDYTVIMVFAVTPDKRILILDIYRDKLLGSEQIKLIDSVVLRWKPQIIGIEAVQYQAAFIEQLLSRGLNVRALHPQRRKKYERAEGIQTRLCAGHVYFKAGTNWLSDFEAELTEFPRGNHDDQVDAFAYIEDLAFINSEKNMMGSKRTGRITDNYY